jgi:hypothetical protein
MTNTTYGVTNWDDVEIKKPNPNARKDLYMKLINGENKVRIITKPHEFTVYKYKTNKEDPGYGQRILAPIGADRDPLKDRGFKSQKRWLVGIIDRRTQSYKILDLSPGAFKGIQELVREEDWGDPSQYDINIKVDKQAAPANYYTIIPIPKKPLNAGDLELKQQVDLDDLKRRCTPPTPEQVEERMKAIDDKTHSEGSTATHSTTQGVPETAEEDIDFPAVDGSDAT